MVLPFLNEWDPVCWTGRRCSSNAEQDSGRRVVRAIQIENEYRYSYVQHITLTTAVQQTPARAQQQQRAGGQKRESKLDGSRRSVGDGLLTVEDGPRVHARCNQPTDRPGGIGALRNRFGALGVWRKVSGSDFRSESPSPATWSASSSWAWASTRGSQFG